MKMDEMKKAWKRAESFSRAAPKTPANNLMPFIRRMGVDGEFIIFQPTVYERVVWFFRKTFNKKYLAASKRAIAIDSNYSLSYYDTYPTYTDQLVGLHEWAAALNRACEATVLKNNLDLRIALGKWRQRMWINPLKIQEPREK